tara:strand:- start:4764 stop:5546 length:783 start_codon:yes stop_codon:yes gene_type:complete
MHQDKIMVWTDFLAVLPWIALVFAASGAVKGISGFGMPYVAMPGMIIGLQVPVTQAVGWVLVSGFATNIVQLIQHRREWPVLGRLWPLLVSLLVTMAISVQFLSYLDGDALLMLVGGMTMITILSQWWGKWTISPGRFEKPVLVASGFFSGLFGGMTSFYGFPSLQVLLASGIQRETFVFMASLILLSGGLVLGSGLGMQGLMNQIDLLISLLMLIPAVGGLYLGQFIQRRLSPRGFNAVLTVTILGMGFSMFLRGLSAL